MAKTVPLLPKSSTFCKRPEHDLLQNFCIHYGDKGNLFFANAGWLNICPKSYVKILEKVVRKSTKEKFSYIFALISSWFSNFSKYFRQLSLLKWLCGLLLLLFLQDL